MNTKFIIVISLSIFTNNFGMAEDLYRWIDPISGDTQLTTVIPPYPIKEKREAGVLPNGNIIELILDQNAPETNKLIENKKEAKVNEEQIVAKKNKLRAITEEEAIRRGKELDKQKVAKEEEEERKLASRLRPETIKKMLETKGVNYTLDNFWSAIDKKIPM